MKKVTYYDVLGVPRSAKLTDVTRAYNRHKSEVTRENAPPDLKRETLIREAYETLSDADRRDRYDASLVAPDRRRRSRLRGAWIGAIGVTLAAAYLIFARPAPEPAVQARLPQEILDAVGPAIGRVHGIEISGSSMPVGMAFAIADGVLVTTCGSLTPSSQILVKIPPRSIPARVANVDPVLDLCRLTAEGVGARPLELAGSAKTGDLVYAAKVNASGELQLTQTTVKAVAVEPRRQVRVYQAGAWGISGAPLLDVQGRVIGVATDDKGHHIPVPVQWIAEAREPLRDQKPAVEVMAPAAGSHGAHSAIPKTIEDIPPERREKLEKAYRPPASVEDEIAKMK